MNKPIDKERADAHYSGMLAELVGPAVQASVALCYIGADELNALNDGKHVTTTLTQHIAFNNDIALYAAPVALSAEITDALTYRHLLFCANAAGFATVTDAIVKAAAPAPVLADLTDSDIRDVLIAHGFKIHEGMDDLKPYVYAAARALLARSQS